jgi:hypothetical protein
MDAKEILGKVQLFFNDLINPAPTAAAGAPPPMDGPKEYELKIGGKVMIDKLEPGGMVVIDGNPALPGDLELMDGTVVTVGDNGAITEIKPGAAAPAPPPPQFDATQFDEFKLSATQKFTDYETKFASYETKFTEYEAKMAKSIQLNEELLKLCKVLVDAPAAKPDPAIPAPAGFSDEKKKFNIDGLF